jgi:hypothetical protein
MVEFITIELLNQVGNTSELNFPFSYLQFKSAVVFCHH